MTSARKFYISKSFKKWKTIRYLAEKFGNVLAFDKESKTKQTVLLKILYIYNDFRAEISSMAKWKIFLFRKNFIQILRILK